MPNVTPLAELHPDEIQKGTWVALKTATGQNGGYGRVHSCSMLSILEAPAYWLSVHCWDGLEEPTNDPDKLLQHYKSIRNFVLPTGREWDKSEDEDNLWFIEGTVTNQPPAVEGGTQQAFREFVDKYGYITEKQHTTKFTQKYLVSAPSLLRQAVIADSKGLRVVPLALVPTDYKRVDVYPVFCTPDPIGPDQPTTVDHVPQPVPSRVDPQPTATPFFDTRPAQPFPTVEVEGKPVPLLVLVQSDGSYQYLRAEGELEQKVLKQFKDQSTSQTT